jgi:hypothetical protein
MIRMKLRLLADKSKAELQMAPLNLIESKAF